MKLLRCHIENFGKLHRADYDFKEDLTQFCQDNGYGKTTLAAFLKAMFYGLPSRTRFNDRILYYPFDGGKFGGNLTFEMKGKEYRIERFFDKKSETKDELTVYCGGAPYDFGTEIGKAVFGLDKESFERTAFFTDADAEDDIEATSGIGEKLNRFVEHTEGEAGFEGAADALDKARKDLKKRGGGGRIDAAQTELSALVKEIENLEEIGRSLSVHYERRRALQETVASAEEQIAAANGKNIVFEQWKHYESLLAVQRERAREAEEIAKNYAGGIPTREELAQAKSEMAYVETQRELKTHLVFSDEKIEKLQYYDRVFARGVPGEETLASVRVQAEEVNRLRGRLSADETEKDERFSRLEQKFAGGLPSEEKEGEIERRVEEYRALQQCAAPVASPKKKSPLFLVLAVLAAVIAVAGVGLVFVNTIVGGVLIGVGAVGLGIVAFLYLKKQSARTQDAESAKRLAAMQAAENAVHEFLVPYGYFTQNGVAFDFGAYQKDKQEYLESRARLHERSARTAEARAQLKDLCERLKDFFEGYRIAGDDFLDAHGTLKQNIREYRSLQAEEREFDERQSSSQREIERKLASLKSLYAKYAIGGAPDGKQIERMISDAGELERLKREEETAGRQAEAYRAENNLTQKPTSEEVDVAPLNATLAEARSELAAIERHIADEEADSERLADKKANREALEEELARMTARYKTLSAALELLQEADKNLKDRYVAPVKTSFLKYADAIEAMLGERMSMNADFTITFERGGEQRSDRHLSAGQRSVCALCFRLALLENMYEDEKPFLVLDDPFAGLDKEHFKKTAETLKTLAREFQIIYFCCHESRKVLS